MINKMTMLENAIDMADLLYWAQLGIEMTAQQEENKLNEMELDYNELLNCRMYSKAEALEMELEAEYEELKSLISKRDTIKNKYLQCRELAETLAGEI